jgi:hypothetical protein
MVKYISRMVSKQKQSSNIVPSEYVKNMEKLSKLAGFDHQNAIVFSVLIGEIKELEKKFAKVKEVVDDLENRVDTIFSSSFRKPLNSKKYNSYKLKKMIEEQIALEPGKENSSDSSYSEEEIIIAEASIPKKKRQYPGKKKVN